MVTLNLTTPAPATLSQPLSFANTFTDSLAALNLGVIADYQFGSSASGSAPVIPIRNATDLAASFNAFSDVGSTSVNVQQIERYQPLATAANFVFSSDHLALTCALEGGGSADILATLVTTVTTTAGTVLTFASTTGAAVGSLIAVSGIDTGYARVASFDATTVTLTSNVTIPSGTTVYFMPVYVPSGVLVGSSTATINCSVPIPANIAAGMFYGNITNGTFGTKRVVSTTSTSITLDGTVSPSANALLFFQPPVTSGQIWTKVGYQPGKNGANVIAGELTCQVPGNTKRGAWPAFWLYSRSSDGFSFDASELDIFEFNIGATSNAGAYSGNDHGGLYDRYEYQIGVGVSSKWDAFGFYRPTGGNYSLTTHKFQFIWTKDRIYRFIDGQLITARVFVWSSACSAQIGMNSSAGSYLSTFIQNLLWPLGTSQFPYSLDLYELKIWQA